MSIDRDAALKRAEKLLRQGKLDGAIEEYVRLVADQPKDWNSINALGDLYVRAGDAERAVAQFTRIADHLFTEGFFPKAAALYKKALKVRSDHEPTLLRLGDIASQQGLLADAKHYLRQVARQRRDRQDNSGAAECLVQLAGYDPDDGEAQAAGASAAEELGDAAAAVRLYKRAAAAFAKQHRMKEALDARARAVRLDPADADLRAQLARDFVDNGQTDRAREFLTRESAGDNPELVLALARAELAAHNEAEGRALLTRAVMIAPDRHGDVTAIADTLLADGRVDGAYGCIEVVCDAAVLAGDWHVAIGALRHFVESQARHRPAADPTQAGGSHAGDQAHIGALSRLVEVSIDAGRDDVLRDAQAALADAYLAGGRAHEARVIAEDLVATDPSAEAHRDRLRRALEALGVPDIEDVLAATAAVDSVLPESLDLLELDASSLEAVAEAPVALEGDAPSPTVRTQPAPVEPEPTAIDDAMDLDGDDDDGRIVLEALEIDLSDIVAGIKPVPVPASVVARSPTPTPAAPAPEPPSLAAPEPTTPLDVVDESPDPLDVPPPAGPSAPPADLEAVFEEMRARALGDEETAGARSQYDRALANLAAGRRLPDAILDLQAAARVPSLRFQAAAALGRIHLSRGELHPGVEWLERAAEAPASSADEGDSILYELAHALERMGEQARALAILIELETHVEGYRDVRARIEALMRAQESRHS